MNDYNADLKNYFPNCEFNELHDVQNRAISNVVEKKENTLCIMPFGIERSIVYWLSAVKLGGICLVISPMWQFVEDQAEKISDDGYKVLKFIKNVPSNEQKDNLIQLANGEINPDFIFASPERLEIDGLFEYCLKKRSKDIKLIVIDEAQCVTQWGDTFRPSYKRIPNFLNRVFENKNNWCRILALSAALNPGEDDEICNIFKIDERNIIKEKKVRNEIQLHVQKFDSEDDKQTSFRDIIRMHNNKEEILVNKEKILVYVYQKEYKEDITKLCKIAKEEGYTAAFLRSNMNHNEYNEVITNYKKGNTNLLFTTYSYGMNVDIEDIRVVIHLALPESVGQYYQEISSAARDKKGANAYLLYTDEDIKNKHDDITNNNCIEEETLTNAYKKIAEHADYVTDQDFKEENIKKYLPYYILCGAVEIAGKGFPDLKFLKDINDTTIQKYYDSTETKKYVDILAENNSANNKNTLTPDVLSTTVYEAMVNGKVTVLDAPEKLIVLKVNASELDSDALDVILTYNNGKKEHKKKLVDDLIDIIEENTDNMHLLPRIAQYLYKSEYPLNHIYTTLDGNIVRSKSEVIIADLLYKEGIKYTYEKKLSLGGGKPVKPDFTICHNNKIYYWEHVGKSGDEDYRNSWLYKKEKYEKYCHNKRIITYDSGVLSKEAQEIIDKIKNDEI